MSSGPPMWFCYECITEMRPVMVPVPTCTSCQGTFVEMMENPLNNSSNEPQEPQHHRAAGISPEGSPPGADNLLLTLQGLVGRGMSEGLIALQGLVDRGLAEGLQFHERMQADHQPRRATGSDPIDRRISEGFLALQGLVNRVASQSPPLSAHRTGSGSFVSQLLSPTGGPRTAAGRRPNPLGARAGELEAGVGRTVQRMSSLLRRRPDANDNTRPTRPITAQRLIALVAHLNETLARRGNDSSGHGRSGDYVSSQAALNQVISTLMEAANPSRRTALTEGLLQNLPREILGYGSSALQKDCAICKDQFRLGTEDPAEQTIVTLPCIHIFHEPCILPWLRSNNTCPVCRHILTPENLSDPVGPGPGSSSSFQPPITNHGGNSISQSGGEDYAHYLTVTPGTASRRPERPMNYIPGGWGDELD